MISYLAYLAAIVFWAPANGGHPLPCRYSDIAVAPLPAVADSVGWATIDRGSCRVNLTPTFMANHPGVGEQCTVIAHELGHSYFGLEHSPDPTNVMYANAVAIPHGCQPARPPARRHRHRHMHDPAPG